MRALCTLIFFAGLSALTLGCDTGDVVSMTIDQRETEVIPGLGLGRQIAIEVDDIETSAGPFRSGPSIERLRIIGPDVVLAEVHDARFGDRIPFVWQTVQYEVRIEGFEEHLIRDDTVDLLVYRKAR